MDAQPPNEEPKPVLEYERPQKPQVPMYRKALAGIMVCGGLLVLVDALSQSNPSAQMNIMLTGLMLIVLGIVIRYQHVRL